MARGLHIRHIAEPQLGLQIVGVESHLRSSDLILSDKDAVQWLVIERAANAQYIRMVRRRVRLVESRALSRMLCLARPILRSGWYSAIKPDLWSYGLFAHTGATLTFTPEEHGRGRAALAAMGIGRDDWFVCFHARDPSADSGLPTNYKSAEITNYLEAARLVVERGGWALRMGADAGRLLPTPGNSRIIDYATQWRDDFLDVYLCAHCRFFLGSSAGLAYLAVAFNVPVAIANLAPLGNPPQSARDRFLPKLICHKGEPLTFEEAHHLGLFSAGGRRLAELGLSFCENDSSDIRDLCEDMLDGEPTEAQPIQERYRDRFFAVHAQHASAPLIGARYALKHRYLMPQN